MTHRDDDALPVALAWRGALVGDELVALAAGSRHGTVAWWERIRAHSLGWVTARLPDGSLVGFANVAWDGGDHAFLLDPRVHPDHRRRGIGRAVVARAVRGATEAGCEWIEVDFEDDPGLEAFYFVACGFQRTQAGLISLIPTPST